MRYVENSTYLCSVERATPRHEENKYHAERLNRTRQWKQRRR